MSYHFHILISSALQPSASLVRFNRQYCVVFNIKILDVFFIKRKLKNRRIEKYVYSLAFSYSSINTNSIILFVCSIESDVYLESSKHTVVETIAFLVMQTMQFYYCTAVHHMFISRQACSCENNNIPLNANNAILLLRNSALDVHFKSSKLAVVKTIVASL